MRPPPPILCAALAALAALLAACAGEESPARRPDVVLVLVDTLRADRLSCYGHPRPTSPVLDALAAEGALFEDVTAQCPWTLPSMVSMFHGRYLTSYRDELAAELPTITRSFRDAGYRTLAVVANWLVDADQGFGRGFMHFDLRMRKEQGEGRERMRCRDIQELLDDLERPLAKAVQPDATGERPPLFLYVHAYDPHAPYLGHAELDAELPLADAVRVQPPGWWERELEDAGLAPPEGGADWRAELGRMERRRARYDQEVRYLDAGLARLVEMLDRHGLREHAVIALVSDHGEGLWDHRPHKVEPGGPPAEPETFFYDAHGGAGYQDQLRTPMILWGAGVPAGLRITAGVENVDLYPTLLELSDLPPPPGLDGRSLVPLFEGEGEGWREHVFNYGLHAVSVRELSTGLKLIVPGPARPALDGRVELFDLLRDPHERSDLSGARPGDVQRLTQVLGDWLAGHTLEGSLATGDPERRAELLRKLRELGYTESETGLPVGH